MSSACSPQSKLSKTSDSKIPPPKATVTSKTIEVFVSPKNLKYNIIQDKNSIKYISQKNSKPSRKGSEVFVSNIPEDYLGDKLLPVFEKAGEIYKFDLMMESTNLNKGYGFLQYHTPVEADKSINLLNNFEIRPKRCLSVSKSEDNNRLFVGGIPKDRQQDDVYEEMKKQTEGVRNVILYPSVNDRSKNRGYAFVEYNNHKMAATARNKLISSRPLLWGCHEVKVDWAEPEYDVDAETMSKVKVLYVRNLAGITSEMQLKEVFTSLGGIVERVKKQKDYAFIHFATREQAQEAKEKFHETTLDGCVIEITWSKPVKNRDEYQQRKVLARPMAGICATAAQPYPIANRDPYLMIPARKAIGSQPTLVQIQSGNIVFSQPPQQFAAKSPVELMPEFAYTYNPQCEMYNSTPSITDKNDNRSPDEITIPTEYDCQQHPYGQQANLQAAIMNGSMFTPQPYMMPSQHIVPHMFAPQPHMTPMFMTPQNPYGIPAHAAIPAYFNQLNTAAYYQGQPVAQIPAIASPTTE